MFDRRLSAFDEHVVGGRRAAHVVAGEGDSVIEAVKLFVIVSVAWLAATAEAGAIEVPEPAIVSEAKAGPCRMTVLGGTSSFLIVVTGLKPGETLNITSRSEGEVLRWESAAQDDGRYGTVVIPLVKGKSFGTASLEVAGQRCRIEASYPWRE